MQNLYKSKSAIAIAIFLFSATLLNPTIKEFSEFIKFQEASTYTTGRIGYFLLFSVYEANHTQLNKGNFSLEELGKKLRKYSSFYDDKNIGIDFNKTNLDIGEKFLKKYPLIKSIVLVDSNDIPIQLNNNVTVADVKSEKNRGPEVMGFDFQYILPMELILNPPQYSLNSQRRYLGIFKNFICISINEEIPSLEEKYNRF